MTDQNCNIFRSGKIARKVDLRYLKMLKTKKLNTKKTQMKHFLCSNIAIFKICDDIQNWFVQSTDQKKTAKKGTKNWNWPSLISQLLKTSNINTSHKYKMVWNKRHNFQTRILEFGDQKNSLDSTDTNSTNRTFHK